MKILEPGSDFYVKSDFTLSATDNEVLALLYAPLLKSKAFALYHILHSYSLVQKGYETNEKFILDYDFPDSQFIQARERLEALGLLETYREEKKELGKPVHYLYKLLPPATPKKFFDDILLKTTLASQLGNKEFQRRKAYFKVTNKESCDGYLNVSVAFKDVFSLDDLNGESLKDNDEEIKTLEKNYKTQTSFSMDKVKENLIHMQLKVINLDECSQDIVNYAVLYGLKEDECASLIEKNTTTDNMFSFSSFLTDVKTMKRFATSKSEQEKNDYDSKGKISKILKVFASITPREYLNEKLGSEPPDYMLKEIIKIQSEIGLNDSVINVVLDYCFRKLKGEFNQTYIEKVCYSLAAMKINNASDAMVYLNQRDYQQSSATNKKARRKTNKKGNDISEEGNENKEDSDLSISELHEEFDL